MDDNPSLKKVIFLVPSLDGGIGRVISLLALGMDKKGMNVEVWSVTSKSGYAHDLDGQISCKSIGSGSVKSAFIPLISQLRSCGPTTLISASFHTNVMALLASLFVRSQIKFIISDHPSIDAAIKELSLPFQWIWKALIWLLYPLADAHIAVSDGVAKAMSKYGRIERSKIVVIPNPVITHEMKTQGSAAVDHPFFEMDEPVILSVGRLSQEKDISTLIHAFKRVQQTIASRLIVVGDGPERDQLEGLVSQEKIDQNVSFLGHQDNPYAYYSKSDLFALSSTREGLPTVLIEALSFGLKVVSTDCPSGPREILKDGTYGRLVPPKDSAALAEAIIEALKGPALKSPASELEKYTVETAVMSYKKVV